MPAAISDVHAPGTARGLVRVFTTIVLMLSVTGCVTQKSVTIDVEESPAAVERIAIRQARAAQNGAMAAGDHVRAATYWTDDVSLRRGLGTVINGKAAYLAQLQTPVHRDSLLVYDRQTTEVETSLQWPLAFETGTWAGHLASATGPVVIGGRYSAQWVKREGRWLIRGEVFVALTCTGIGCSYTALP